MIFFDNHGAPPDLFHGNDDGAKSAPLQAAPCKDNLNTIAGYGSSESEELVF